MDTREVAERVKVRWAWKSLLRGRQTGVGELLPNDGHAFRLYRVQWDDGTVGLVRSDCLVIAAAAANADCKH